MRNRLAHTFPNLALGIAVFLASAGFMTIIETGCPVGNAREGMACSMECCSSTGTMPAEGNTVAPVPECHTVLLAGLPSTLLSIPVAGSTHLKIDNVSHSIHSFDHHTAIPNQNSALTAVRCSESPPSVVEKYIIISSYRI